MICDVCGSEKEEKRQCKNCKQIYDQKRYQENRAERLISQKKYNQENSSEILKYQNEYYKNHLDKILLRQSKYKKEMYMLNVAYKLRAVCSSMIYQAMKSSKNNSSILDYLPYTMDELKAHLESKFDDNMAWDNYGVYWQIDHIIPQSKLLYTSMESENFKKCWALENLQPLEAVANRKKHDKIIKS